MCTSAVSVTCGALKQKTPWLINLVKKWKWWKFRMFDYCFVFCFVFSIEGISGLFHIALLTQKKENNTCSTKRGQRATPQCDLFNEACLFGGIICVSSVYLITTDPEYQPACCQILERVSIMLTHWGGIQAVFGPSLWENIRKWNNPRLIQVIWNQSIIFLQQLEVCLELRDCL